MSQDTVRTVQAIDEAEGHADLPNAEHATQRSRKHYAALVAKYFDYAHSNRLEEVVAMFTDDAFATFVVATEPFSGKEAIRGFYAQLFQDFPHIEPEIFAVIIEGNRAITRAEDDHRQARRHPRGDALQHQSLHLRGRSHQDPARDGQPRLIPPRHPTSPGAAPARGEVGGRATGLLLRSAKRSAGSAHGFDAPPPSFPAPRNPFRAFALSFPAPRNPFRALSL
jgi:hypothetical protein